MLWYSIKLLFLLLLCGVAVINANNYTSFGAGVISMMIAGMALLFVILMFTKSAKTDGPEGLMYFPHIVICALSVILIWSYYAYSNWDTLNLTQIVKVKTLTK